jgi:hypothetical protein
MQCTGCGKDTLDDVDFCIWCRAPLLQNRTTARRAGPYKQGRITRRKIVPLVLLFAILLGSLAIIGSTIQSASPYAGRHVFPGPSMLDGAYPERGGYTLRGVTSTIDLSGSDNQNVYETLDARQPERYAGESDAGYYARFLDDPDQKSQVDEILSQIRAKTPNADDQARICISLVQHIPYDAETTSRVRYPYQVLSDTSGDGDEKSLLLAYLLRELGYGVALLWYEPEDHMAVGVSASPDYDCHDSGYAFIETTRPGIVTDDKGEYTDIGTPTSVPTVIPISQGRSFASIDEEFKDAGELADLRGMRQPLDSSLNSYNFARMQILGDKYALDAENQ